MQESVDLHRVFTVKKVICKVRIIMYAVWIILWFPWDINVFTIHLAWSVRIVLRFLDSLSKYCFLNMNCMGCVIYRIYNVLYNVQIIIPILHLWVLLLLSHYYYSFSHSLLYNITRSLEEIPTSMWTPPEPDAWTSRWRSQSTQDQHRQYLILHLRNGRVAATQQLGQGERRGGGTQHCQSLLAGIVICYSCFIYSDNSC